MGYEGCPSGKIFAWGMAKSPLKPGLCMKYWDAGAFCEYLLMQQEIPEMGGRGVNSGVAATQFQVNIFRSICIS